jgi:hypothetical protein
MRYKDLRILLAEDFWTKGSNFWIPIWFRTSATGVGTNSGVIHARLFECAFRWSNADEAIAKRQTLGTLSLMARTEAEAGARKYAIVTLFTCRTGCGSRALTP